MHCTGSVYGAGTVALTAEALDRRWIGFDVISEYCELIKQNIITSKAGLKLYTEVSNGLFDKEKINIKLEED